MNYFREHFFFYVNRFGFNAQAMEMRTLLLIKEAISLSTICLLMIACRNKVNEKSAMAEIGIEQQTVYESMEEAIYTNDTAKFDSLLQCIPAIDSLLPEKEADLSYTLLAMPSKTAIAK